MGELTYEHLFDVVRRERSREELQALDPEFYQQAKTYTDIMTEKARTNDVLSKDGEQARTQLQNANKLLKELYDRRERKIVLLALNKARTGSSIIDTTALLSMEKTLYESLVAALLDARKSYGRIEKAKPRKEAKQATPKPEEPRKTPEKPPADMVRVKIISSVPRFMGAQSETYGPYEKDEEAQLPEKIADILVRKGRAETMKA